MPIGTNLSVCLAHGYNTSECWYNYTVGAMNLSNASSSINPLGVIQLNLPWFGMGIWVVTYIALFILFSKSGGREKFFAMGVGGFIATVAYAQVGLLGQALSIAEISTFTFSFLIMIISIIAYALIKDAGE